jgi:hypothetical protein
VTQPAKLVKTSDHQANRSLSWEDEPQFFEIKAMRRWAWGGCRWASGFATEVDAREAFRLLGLTDQTKSLRVGKQNRAILTQVEALVARGWAR